MKLLLKLALVAIIGLFLSGCNPDVIVKDHFVLILPRDTLLQDCTSTPPPDRQKYQDAVVSDQKTMALEWGMKQTGNLNTCNVTKANEREWKARQLKNYEGKDVTIKDGE